MCKNILFVVHNLKIGGIQKITLDTARYHARIGNNVTILLIENKIELDVDFDCKIECIGLFRAFKEKPWIAIYYILYKAILRNLFKESEFIWSGLVFEPLFNKFKLDNDKFDAVFVNGARSMSYLHSIKGDNIVYSIHLPHVLSKSENNNIYYNYLFRKLFSNKKIYAVSDFIKNPIENKAKFLQVDIKAIETIYNPCDIEKISAMSQEPIQFTMPYILGVGRLSKQKRFDRLIRAYEKSKINQKLVIIGDGNQKDNLNNIINELKLEDKVFLIGFDKNPFKWMKNADFFVLSSDVEGFVLVVNEALACGKPVVATDCGPITEILTGDLAIGISEKNVDNLSEKIKQFSENPVYPSSSVLEKLSFSSIITRQMQLSEVKQM